MRKLFLTLVLAVTSISAFAQAKIDTLYYDKEGYGVSIKEFADYYRIALTPDDPLAPKKYRDFHINGEMMSTGTYISLDKYDDRNSKFVGSIVIYDKNGNLSAARNYKNGVLDGLSEQYMEDGSIIQEEFSEGKPAKDYYIKTDGKGNLVKIRYSDNCVIWESPDKSEMLTDYHDGDKWYHYSKNGVTIALNTDSVKDFGKYHAINLTIDNNSLVPIEFEPSCNISATSINYKKGEETMLKVYSCDEYLRKYDNRNAWMSALYGISEVSAAIGGGSSEQTTVSVNNKGEQSVSYTQRYDPFANYVAWDIAHRESVEFNKQVVEGREVRRVGYLKRTTVYPGDAISGFAYIQRVKGNEITVNIDIQGANYTFTWKYGKK